MSRMSYEEIRQFNSNVRDIIKHHEVQRMKKYIQHGTTSTYEHCVSVAKASYKLDRFLHAKSDKKALLKGAMLHDFYLYDWHVKGSCEGLHGYHHADSALTNAKEHFNIGKKEEDIIFSHMWPLNITRIPRRREAWIVCLADKYVSIKEIFDKDRLNKKEL